MIPIKFENCFGWIHSAFASSGIVMCSPVGFEELATHRSWVELADSFASQGYMTLRFDYEGTNDSLGNESNNINLWINNIKQAIKVLRDNHAIKEITLVGLRFGATLAALASQDESIEKLVLIAPIVNGKSYTRELKMLSEVWWSNVSPISSKLDTSSGIEVIGTKFSNELLVDIAKIDLRKIDYELANNILIFDPGKRNDTKLFYDTIKGYQSLERIIFDGLDEYISDAVLSIRPTKVFCDITKWLGKGNPITHPQLVYSFGKTIARTNEFEEQAINFGVNNKLFGIITNPIIQTDKPPLIILNTGPNHHVGNGRLSVTIARDLAVSGYSTLRFDLAGIGDSLSIEGRDSPLYTVEACPDVSQAVDLMTNNRKSKNCIVLGLCSGAFLGLHSTLRDTRIKGLAMVNLQRFIWKEGTSLQIATKSNKRSTKFYAKAILRPATWLRIINGNAKIIDTVKVISSRPFDKLKRKYSKVSASQKLVYSWMEQLSKSNVQTGIWYSAEDPGLSELDYYFESGGRLLKSMPNMNINIIPDADHSLNGYKARMFFIEQFKKYMVDITHKMAQGHDS